MKNTIQIFQSYFIKLVFLNFFFFSASSFTFFEEIRTLKTVPEFINDSSITGIPIYDNLNLAQAFKPDSVYFVVLKNNRNCLQCFRAIDDFVKSNKGHNAVKFLVISLIDSSSLERKRTYYENRRLMPSFDGYFFQYWNSSASIFKEVGTDYTPEILIINKRKTTHIPYPEIMNYDSFTISVPTQLKIYNLLK